MAAVDLRAPVRGSGTMPDPAGPVAVGGFSLRVFDAGLACCAVEVSAALRRCAELLADGGAGSAVGADLGDSAGRGSAPGNGPSPVNVLVVAGTVTDKLAPLVLAAYR